MGIDKQIRIQVIYALPERQFQVTVELPAGSTASMALAASGLLKKFPELDLQRQKIGIHGQIVKPNYVLKDGQRLEIYRPLTRDPKQARRERAVRAKRTGDTAR